jgi:hypothetical protein
LNSTPMKSNSYLCQPLPTPSVKRPTGELLQRRYLLRRVHRVVRRHEHDRGAEPDPFRPARRSTDAVAYTAEDREGRAFDVSRVESMN